LIAKSLPTLFAIAAIRSLQRFEVCPALAGIWWNTSRFHAAMAKVRAVAVKAAAAQGLKSLDNDR
jgi:hypothetical protein